MKVYTCTDHDGHYPVGVASVVVAETLEQAGLLLDSQLLENGLGSFLEKPYILVELSLELPKAIVLANGDY